MPKSTPTTTEKKDIHILIDSELRKQAMIKCLQEDVNLTDVIIQYLEKWTGYTVPAKPDPRAKR